MDDYGQFEVLNKKALGSFLYRWSEAPIGEDGKFDYCEKFPLNL